MTYQNPKNKLIDDNSKDIEDCVDYDTLGVLTCFPEEAEDIIYNPFYDWLTGGKK